MFKIFKDKTVVLRYSIIMTLVGIFIIILSQTISFGTHEYSEGVSTLRNLMLLCGVIFTAYGGFISVNKILKDNEKKV